MTYYICFSTAGQHVSAIIPQGIEMQQCHAVWWGYGEGYICPSMPHVAHHAGDAFLVKDLPEDIYLLCTLLGNILLLDSDSYGIPNKLSSAFRIHVKSDYIAQFIALEKKFKSQ